MANWSNDFPSWGDTGEQPPSNKNYGAEQVNEKHFDYLWDQLNKTFDDILDHTIQDDGSVDMAADLDMGGNNIDNLDELRDDDTAAKINFPGDGRVLIDVDDGSGGITPSMTLSAGPQADVTVDNGDLYVMEGDIDLNGNDLVWVDEIHHGDTNAAAKFLNDGSWELDVDSGSGGFTTAMTVDAATGDVNIDGGDLVIDGGQIDAANSIIDDVNFIRFYDSAESDTGHGTIYEDSSAMLFAWAGNPVFHLSTDQGITMRGNDLFAVGEVGFSGGAKIYKNGSGELVAVDDFGNETVLT